MDSQFLMKKIGEYFDTLIARSLEMNWKLYFTDDIPRMALFVSKMPHCLFDILARYTAGEWDIEIPLIISNHETLKPVAERFGIDFYHFPVTSEKKAEQEEKEVELLKQQKIDFVVLARYMQVLSGDFVKQFPNKIINIHHSFLPAFAGAKPYHAALETWRQNYWCHKSLCNFRFGCRTNHRAGRNPLQSHRYC
jgi:formyltetrahydrofolate deformylase